MLQHVESAVKINFSKDYGSFKMINGNRELNEHKIKRIEKDINSGIDVLKYCPIMVVESNNRLEIIDGQHRFWVAKKLLRPIHYVLVSDLNLHAIAKINSNTEKWKGEDFLNCYIQLGNENYVKLRAFMEKYHLSITTAVVLLTLGYNMNDSGSHLESGFFEKGEFVIKTEQEAEIIAEHAIKFSKFKYWKNRSFLAAIAKILVADKCSFKELVEKFVRNSERLEKQEKYKEYLINLENIYNIGAHTRKVIY